MQIERKDNEILIRVSANTDLTGLQRILEYIKFREIASKSKVTFSSFLGLDGDGRFHFLRLHWEAFCRRPH